MTDHARAVKKLAAHVMESELPLFIQRLGLAAEIYPEEFRRAMLRAFDQSTAEMLIERINDFTVMARHDLQDAREELAVMREEMATLRREIDELRENREQTPMRNGTVPRRTP